jgi:hypothetical protein
MYLVDATLVWQGVVYAAIVGMLLDPRPIASQVVEQVPCVFRMIVRGQPKKLMDLVAEQIEQRKTQNGICQLSAPYPRHELGLSVRAREISVRW